MTLKTKQKKLEIKPLKIRIRLASYYAGLDYWEAIDEIKQIKTTNCLFCFKLIGKRQVTLYASNNNNIDQQRVLWTWWDRERERVGRNT